ncbi:MAG TPA: hypothetical protein VHF27_07720 [Acidimicrobiales bacterium]|nr:hypothetical protein [Acidimicrobiales bacterium]
MLRTLLLSVHVGAGVAGLLAGPPAMAAALEGRRGTTAGRVYLAAVTLLTATAAGLVALRPAALWPFLLLAVGTEAAIVGAGRVRPHARHVRLVCGSYVSLVTALLVVSWGSVLAWVLPTVVGTVLVERAASSTRLPRPARRSSRSPAPSPLP